MGAFVLQLARSTSCASSRPMSAAASARRSITMPKRRSSPGRRPSVQPAGQMDRRAQRKLHLRRAWPRPRHPCRAGARQGRQVPRAARCRRSPIWAPICRPSRPCDADLSLRDAARRHVHDAGDLCRGEGACSPTPCRSTPIAAPDGPRRRYLVERIVDTPRARWASTRPNCAGATSSRPTPSLPDAGRAALRQRRLLRRRSTMAMQASPTMPGFEARASRGGASAASCAASAIATYIEACGIAPSAVAGALGARAGLYEVGARCGSIPTGSVTVLTGSHSHGQGHETTFAQLVADRLGMPDRERSRSSTATPARSPSAWAPMARARWRSAAPRSSRRWTRSIAKGKKIAAHLLEAAEADIEFKDGKFSVAGTDRSQGLRRDRAGRLRAAQLSARRARARARRDRVLRPEELHLPVGHAYLRGRDRSGHRRRGDRQLHRRRRFRPHHQPDDRRGPGAWRARAGHRPGAARRLRLRHAERAAADRLATWTTRCRAPTICRPSRWRPTSRRARTTRSASKAAARPARSARRRR